MIGNGMPISQSSAPFPKDMVISSVVLNWQSNAHGVPLVPADQKP
jgi:hypothetical protein